MASLLVKRNLLLARLSWLQFADWNLKDSTSWMPNPLAFHSNVRREYKFCLFFTSAQWTSPIESRRIQQYCNSTFS